jgi:S-DNA-T family DNA segregation ATPase FtsK/SpoIIIE
LANKKSKRKQTKAKTKAIHPRIRDFLIHRLQEGIILAILATAGFLLLSLTTYHPSDPSWSNLVSTNFVQNSAGRAGAWFADVLLYLCGYLSYLLPILLTYSTWLLFKQRQQEKENHPFKILASSLKILGFILIIGAGSALASLAFSGAAS